MKEEKGDQVLIAPLDFDADERTRTSTRLLPQRPERCASTNSATSALKVGIVLTMIAPVKHGPHQSNRSHCPDSCYILRLPGPPLINIYEEFLLCIGAVYTCFSDYFSPL